MKSSFKNKTVLSHKRLFLNEKGWIGILKSHYSTHTPYLPKKHWLFNRCPDKLWPNTKMLSFLWTQAQGNDKISTWHLARVCSLPVNTDFFMSYKYKYTCIEMRSTKMWFLSTIIQWFRIIIFQTCVISAVTIFRQQFNAHGTQINDQKEPVLLIHVIPDEY